MSANKDILKPKKRKIRKDKGKKRKTTRKIYICDKCKYSTHIKILSLSHYLNYHATLKERIDQYKFYCEHCNFGSMAKVSYDIHLKTKKHRYMLQLIENDLSSK